MTVAMQSYFEDLRIQKTAMSSFAKAEADESNFDQVEPSLEEFEEPSSSSFASDFEFEVVCDNAGTFSPMRKLNKPSCPVLRGYFDDLRQHAQGSRSSILLPSHKEEEGGADECVQAEVKSCSVSSSSSSSYAFELVNDNAILPHSALLRKQSIRRLQQEFSKRRARYSQKSNSFSRSESEGNFTTTNVRHSYPNWRNHLLPPLSSGSTSTTRRKKTSSNSLCTKNPSNSLSSLYGFNDRFSSSSPTTSISERRNETFRSPVSVADTPLYYTRPPLSPINPSVATSPRGSRRPKLDSVIRCRSPSTSGRSTCSSSTRSSISAHTDSSQSISVGTFDDCSISSFNMMDSLFKTNNNSSSNNGSSSSGGSIFNRNIFLMEMNAAPFTTSSNATMTTPTNNRKKLTLTRPTTSLSPRSARWGVLQRQESDSALTRPARSCDR